MTVEMSNASSESSNAVIFSRRQTCMALLLFVGGFLMFHDVDVARRAMEESRPSEHNRMIRETPLGDRLWVKLAQEERTKFHERLRRDYGNENFANIFLLQDSDDETQSHGRTIYTSPHGLSWDRLKRKLMIKILDAKVAAMKRASGEKMTDRHQHEDAEVEYSIRRLTARSLSSHTGDERYYSKFVWATGGHSSAAGHGNFLPEAYTAVLEKRVKPIFASLGIEFVAKPYAMGGTPSGEEVALCIEQIFGDDIDLLVWDYGMMDSSRYLEWRQLLYTYHTAMGRNRPASIGIDFAGDKTRIKIYAELEALGMTVFYENRTMIKQMKDAIPDSQGLTDAEIDQMPPLVKQLRCGAGLERGEPGCRSCKYNETICPRRKGMSSWHPGWKMHALSGNSLALFLTEALMDAVAQLDSRPDQDWQALLDQYNAEEEADYARILESDIPPELSPIANWILGSDDESPFGNVDIRELYKRRSFCHTALLPSDIRYKGLLTQNFTHTGGWDSSYDKGIPKPTKSDPVQEVDTGEMILAFDPRERNKWCPETTRIDFKDFYFLSSKEGWKSLTIPNGAEQQYYGLDTADMMGMVLMCLTQCDWGECKNEDMRDQFDKGHLEMTVNGVQVVEYTKIGICWALKGKDNSYRWEPNEQKKYEIRARLHSKEKGFSYLRFSSFILV
ncbi:expressed unknown protein [Seminavis robusta]|uniref:Uncharacterized protein n=1 Tax=Seminavis robusta TaxID=568900 RepID=A0A9N8HWJ2_9STRA|nr:expressed unknown protein [Seminavis robusta]|eukprot:Sro2193_g318450.1 n/a (674) ;mRNA; f:1728-3908